MSNRYIDIGDDTVVFNIASDGTEVLQILPPTATASLPAATAVPAGTLVYDTTAGKYKFSTGSAYETITST